MMNNLACWENQLRKWSQTVERSARKQAGTLLPVIPGREDWDDFLEAVKENWDDWQDNLERYPNCLLVLYGGLAFYEYDDNTLWRHFAEAVGCHALTGNQQTEINRHFSKVAHELGLYVDRHNNITYSISSAINHIGIPLSLWDGFIDVCEWALAQSGWDSLTDNQWGVAVNKLAGSRKRLAVFLRDNRAVATEMIRKMHAAREKLFANPTLTIADLQQSSILRREYFEDVPETAEFLFPQNPDRFIADPLLLDRAKLAWDNARCHINLYLPAVASNKLPATWHVGERDRLAGTSPHSWRIDAAAFSSQIAVGLQSQTGFRRQLLRGVSPWGLFDLENEMLVNPERQQLPLRPYVLVSPHKLDHVTREGFDEEDYLLNEQDKFDDGTPFFTTRLYPNAKRAQLTITHDSRTSKIVFRAGARIEAKIYTGEGMHAASFSRFEKERDKWIKVERLPLPCIAIPLGYFDDTSSIVATKFQVMIDDRAMTGTWEKRHEDDTHEYYFWMWAYNSSLTAVEHPGTTTCVQPPDVPADTNLPALFNKPFIVSINAPGLNFSHKRKFELRRPKSGMDDCWSLLPGAFISFFLLAQSTDGMNWSDLVLARAAVAPDQKFSYALLRLYERHGILKQRGQRWYINESRAVIETTPNGELHLRYCGDPSVLWSMYRYIHAQDSTLHLPVVEVVNERPTPPYLKMRWQSSEGEKIKKYLQNYRNHPVQIVDELWSD